MRRRPVTLQELCHPELVKRCLDRMPKIDDKACKMLAKFFGPAQADDCLIVENRTEGVPAAKK